MLLLRGGSLRASKGDTIWLISELKAIYQPHLPNIDEMGLSHLWLLLLQICSAPRTVLEAYHRQHGRLWCASDGREQLFEGRCGRVARNLPAAAARAPDEAMRAPFPHARRKLRCSRIAQTDWEAALLLPLCLPCPPASTANRIHPRTASP